MSSSLAAQLAQSASLNKSLLVDRTRRRPTESYLFNSRDADAHDLDAIHALGLNALLKLRTIEPMLGLYEEALFSDAAKSKDRTLLTAEANAELDRAIEGFLTLLAPYLLEDTAGKTIEWLVRRFRVNEFNVEVVLSVFMPYHDAPHFQKMLSILHIKHTTKFAPLLPFRSTATPLTHDALVNVMMQSANAELARWIGGLLPAIVKSPNAPNALHRALVALHTGVLFEFIRRTFGSRGKGKNAAVDEGTIAWILVAASEPLQICTVMQIERSKESMISEVVLSSYLLLSAIAHTCPLSVKAFNAVLKAIATCATRVSSKQVIRTYASVYAGQDSEVTSAKPLAKSVVKTLLQLPEVVAEIQDVFSYVGTERFMSAFGRALVDRIGETHAFDVLTALVTSPSLPLPSIKDLALALIHLHIDGTKKANSDHTDSARARSVLVHMQQRHPATLQEVFGSVFQDTEYADKKDAVEQLLLSLSVALPGPNAAATVAELDMIVASTSADAPVRVIAVRQLYEKLSDAQLPELERDSIRSALLARIQDSNASVLDALYASPAQLLPFLLADTSAYLTTLAELLPSAGKAAVKAHISFVVAHLYPAFASQGGDLSFEVISRVLFPFLLYTRPRHKTTAAVWDLVEAADGEGSVARAEMLAGCVDAVRWEEQKKAGKPQSSATEPGDTEEDGHQNTEVMARINVAIASRIADNIFVSASFDKYFSMILEKMQDTNAYARALAYLICRAVLARLSGEQLIISAHRVLTLMNIKSLEGMGEFARGMDNLQLFYNDLSLSTAVVLKPSKLHTLHRLQVAIVVNIPTIPRPAGVSLEWLTPVNGSEENMIANRYIALMRAVYTLANSTASLHSLSSDLIRTLFLNVGDDALKFLAGIWLHPETSVAAGPAEFAALRHAAAFLEAHFATQRWVDFQTVLPTFLIALQHGDKRMREGALECISALVRLSQADKPTGIYAFDAIYGTSSAELQYLEWSDFCKYVKALQASRDHMLNDATYLTIFHQQHLATVSFEPKKDSAYKQHVLCYLLSHVIGCPIPEKKISLLGTVKDVSSKAKSQTLQPVLEALSSEKTSAQLVRLFGKSYDEFATLVISSVDETAVEALNKPEDLWSVYQTILRHYFHPDSSSSVRSVLAQKLQTAVFPLLQFERKVELCRMLLELGQQSEVAKDTRTILNNVLTDVPVIVRLVTDLQPAPVDAERANKRAKLETAKSDENYSMLVLLAETISSRPLPGSVELASCLLETLNKVVHDASSSVTDKSYVEQLLMSAVENAATNVPSGRSTSSIRLDILVELIRVSDNPQTFNQALLLMATLARLSPEAVLHNVMPVFTFMGSNVFHRDDAYSFRVVQKTIDSIVPVMVSSLKESPSTPLDLYVSSRPFLRIFTDAANHIPRHRRTNFFGHLIDVLGANDFLPPVCMLLVDKSANKVVRQNSEESSNSLLLPLSALQRYGKDLQLATVVEVLHEVQRLIEHGLQPQASIKTFLELQQDEERSAQPSVKKQTASLLIFIAHALKQLLLTPASGSTEHSTTELLPLLLDIAVSKAEVLSAAGMENIPTLAADVVKDALRVMPAANFITGILTALGSGDSSIQRGALELFAEQLPKVATKVRQDSKVVIGKIVDSAKKLLAASSETLAIAALHALQSIADSMIPGEEHALTGAVPPVLKAVAEASTTLLALEVLVAQSHKLGPRLIPYFKEMVKVCSNVIRTHSNNEAISSRAAGVLQGLLASIPNFWSSSEFLQVITLYLDVCGSAPKSQLAPLSSLIKTVAKKAPSKLLLATLCDTWTSLNAEPVTLKLQGYFNVLKRAVHVSDRSVVSDNTKTLFRVFLESFELFAKSASTRETVLEDCIAAFIEVIVKLNETTFKPLFRKMFDWAFSPDKSDLGIGRRLVFCQVYMTLVDYFKNLITPYMSFLLEPFSEILQEFTTSPNSQELWLSIVNTLTKSFTFDEGVFWRDDKLQRLLSPVVSQVAFAARLPEADRTALSECLIAFADALSDDTLLKSLNMDLLMHTRSEEARVRLYALTCSEALWRSQGDKFIGFSAETATFIAECAEDDNDSVAQEAHRLKNAVEAVAGRIEV